MVLKVPLILGASRPELSVRDVDCNNGEVPVPARRLLMSLAIISSNHGLKVPVRSE